MSRLSILATAANVLLIVGTLPIHRPLWLNTTLGALWMIAQAAAHVSHRATLGTPGDTRDDRAMRRLILTLGYLSPPVVVDSTPVWLSVAWACILVLGAVAVSIPAKD